MLRPPRLMALLSKRFVRSWESQPSQLPGIRMTRFSCYRWSASTDLDFAMSDQPPDLVFRVRSSDVEALLMESGGEGSLKPLVTRPAGAAGGGEFANILVPLVSASLGFVAAIATTWIKRPGATVELKDMKVTGASRQTVEALLRRELELPRPMSA